MNIIKTAALLALCLFAKNAHADEYRMVLGGQTSSPYGYLGFCARYKTPCQGPILKPTVEHVTPEKLGELHKWNRSINLNITPESDLEHWGVKDQWDYAQDGYGDCEDYALKKQKLLLEAGWHRQALLMTVVNDTNGDGHALLTLVTDLGDFVLDSLTHDILLWSHTPYTFIKRQSQENPNSWVSIDSSASQKTASLASH